VAFHTITRDDVERFKQSIRAFESFTGLHVCIHDKSQSVNPVIGDSFYVHTNPFCSALKREPANETKCLDFDTRLIVARCRDRRQPFLKICYGGVAEAVLPVLVDSSLCAVMFIGPFVWKEGEPVPPNAITQKTSRSIDPSAVGRRKRLPAFDRERFDELVALGRLLVFRLAAIVERFSPDAEEGPEPRRRIMQFVRTAFNNKVRLGDLARHLSLSESRASRLVRRHFDKTFPELVSNYRMELAKQMLVNSNYTVERVAADVGIDDCAYFHRLFKSATGMTPSRYRQVKERKPQKNP
jgi:AraC-like DNA-binding protein/ligand-binding sensor protein